MGHGHLHRRQHHHRQADDPFAGFESGINSLAAAAASFFGGAPAAASSPSPQVAQSPANDPSSDDGPSTVYVTAPWTGSGEFSYSTQAPASTTSSKVNPFKLTSTKQDASTTLSKSTRPTAASSLSTSAAAAAAAATTSLSSILSITSASDASVASATADPSALASQDGSTGMSGGAKAGIAIGVILAILVLAAGAFALWRMKKNRDQEAYERTGSSEKNPFSDPAIAQSPPPLMTKVNTPPTMSYDAPAPVASNPFGSGATSTLPQAAATSGPALGASQNLAMAAGAGVAAGAVVGASAAHARRTSVPTPLNLNRAQSPALVPPPPIAPSPSGSNFSESSTLTAGAMAAVGGAGAGGAGGPRMHRVQMDFNPTMEDEIQISAGEIVRIVREFDDGWCTVEIVQRDSKGNVLRSSSGVVPRTCLSRLPLKPRQKRPGPPMSAPQTMGPLNPNGPSGRMQSPALIPNPVQRSMSPGPYGGGPQDRPDRSEVRSRSNSASDIGARPRAAPIGPSPMNPASQTPEQLPQEQPAPPQDVNLPIQHAQGPEPPAPPFVAKHSRNASIGSSVSGVARKPVPKKTDA